MTYIEWIYIVLIVLVLVTFCAGVLVEKDIAIQTLQDAGYSEDNCDDGHWFLPGFHGCSGHDSITFNCSAKNPIGKKVNVIVCASAFYKGSTIRH